MSEGADEFIALAGGNTGSAAERHARCRSLLRGTGHGGQRPLVRKPGRGGRCGDVVEFGLRRRTASPTAAPSRSTSPTRNNGLLLALRGRPSGSVPRSCPTTCSFQQGEHMFFGSRTAGRTTSHSPGSGSHAADRDGRGGARGGSRTPPSRLLREPLHRGGGPRVEGGPFSAGCSSTRGLERHPQGRGERRHDDAGDAVRHQRTTGTTRDWLRFYSRHPCRPGGGRRPSRACSRLSLTQFHDGVRGRGRRSSKGSSSSRPRSHRVRRPRRTSNRSQFGSVGTRPGLPRLPGAAGAGRATSDGVVCEGFANLQRVPTQ